MSFSLRLLGACMAVALTASCQQPHLYSTTLSIKLSDWKPGTNTAGQTGFVVDIPLPQIDQKVVESGGVAVYYRFQGSERFEPLPLVFQGVIWHAYHSKGMLWLRMFSAGGGNLGPKLPPEMTDLDAKVVITY